MTNPTISPLSFPLAGKEASRVQLQKNGYLPGDEFWIKVNNNEPYRCLINLDYSFTAIRQVKENDLKNELGGSNWIDNEIYQNGYEHIYNQALAGKNIFILPNHLKHGIGAGHATCFKNLCFEADDKDINKQWELLQAFGGIPSVVVFSGGRSLHVYFSLSHDIDKETWRRLQRTLIYLFKSDRAIQNYNREMRFAGFPRIEKGTEQNIPFIGNQEYSLEEFENILNSYAKKIGVEPYSEVRYSGFQYILNKKARTCDGINYQHEFFDENFFRACNIEEIEERLQRCKLYAKLLEKKDPNPETAWRSELKQVREKVKSECEVNTIPIPPGTVQKQPVIVDLAEKYLKGFKFLGRGGGWHTCQCPVHANGGNHSFDSLHINATSGAVICHSGCDSSEVITTIRTIAKDADDERWNWEDKDKDKENLEVSNAQLNTEIFLYKKATSLDLEKLEELGIKVKRINTKLLTPDELTLEKGKITFVISPKGTGKTKASGEALKDYAALYSWHHRISLGRSIQNTLEVTYFDDLHKARNKHRVSFCAQRSHQLNPSNLRENGALFIDECDQVLDFIFSQLCNSNNNRPLILNALHEQLQAAVFGGVALFMSADIATKEVMLIHSLALPGTPIEIIINEYQPEQGTVHFSTDKSPDGLAVKLIETLRDKKPCFVVDDFKNSYRGGKTLAEILQVEIPDIKLQIIHAENSGSVEVRQFLDNINIESLETDVIVVSPSVISGLSIENGRFKHCFAFVNGILSDSQVLQAINRPRGCENFYIWAADKGLGTEAGGAITPQEVHNFYLRNYDVRNSHFLSYGNRYEVRDDEWKSPFWTLYCENVALDNLIKRRLNFWIKDRLVGEGYAVVDHEFGENKDLVKEQKIIWKKISIAEAVVIGNAKLNNEDEQKKLSAKIEAGISLLPEELASFRKTHIHETFGEEYIKACVKEVVVNKETLEKAILTDYAAVAYLNQNGKLEQGLRRYYKFFKRPIEDCIESDIKRDKEQREGSNEYDGFIFPGDIRWTTREHKFWEGIGFREYLQPERRWQGWELAQIIARIQPNLQQTKDCIGIDFSRPDLRKYYAKGFVELCGRLGLKTESEQASTGDRARSYYITSESLEMAEMFASHQEHRRLLKEELKSAQTPGLYSNSVYLSGVCAAETPTAQHFQQQPDINSLTPPQPQVLVNLEVCSEESHPILPLNLAYFLQSKLTVEAKEGKVNNAGEFKEWLVTCGLTLTVFEENILSKIEDQDLINKIDDWVRVLAI